MGMSKLILNSIDSDEMMQIAKEALPKWSGIRNLTDDIIEAEKNELREHGVQFQAAVDELNMYIDHIKKNYDAICSGLLP